MLLTLRGPWAGALVGACLGLGAPRAAMALSPDRRVSQYAVGVWTHDDGLPVNAVTQVLQTRDGFIWLATQAGLARFGGVGFDVFNRSNTPALPSPVVHCLVEASDGALWVGTSSGLAELRAGRFSVPVRAIALQGLNVRAMVDDGEDGMWVGTQTGLFRLAPAGVVARPEWRESVSVLARTRDGSLWGGGTSGLFRLRGEVLTHYTTKDGLRSDLIRTLSEGADGALWIGSDGGLDRWDGARFSAFAASDGLPGAVWATSVDRAGSLWIATFGGALARLRDGQLSVAASLGGLPAATIQSLFEDREGNLWAGTTSGGLRRLRDARFRGWTTAEGLACRNAWTILEDARHAVWVGCEEGLSRIEDGKVASFTTRQGLSHDAVTSLYESPPGTLWIGTRGGLNRLRDGVITHLDKAEGLLDTGVVEGIGEDGAPGLVLATAKGVRRFADDRATPIVDPKLTGKQVVSLTRGRDRALWLGTMGQGLLRMKAGDISVYDAASGLSDPKVLSAYEDSRGVTWIATFGGGLDRLFEGHATAITSAQGLADDALLQVVPDDLGNLWLSSNSGISRVAIQDVEAVVQGARASITSRSFGRDDGMTSAECNGGFSSPGIHAENGHLWFPTEAGVVEVDPTNLSHNATPPTVVIDDARWGSARTANPEALVLDPGGENLELHFDALTFVDPAHARFRYWLDGYDKAWIDGGTRRTARYTHIPPGAYVFQVLAANEDGVWSERAARLPIRVEPRVDQTLWFRGLSALALLTLAGGGWRTWLARQRARVRELERLVDARTAELRTANQALAALVGTDKLTGLANRRRFDEVLANELKRARRQSDPVALVFLDVDHFKRLNDAFGHPAGDAALERLGAALATAARRPADLAARIGGEEFAILLPGTDGAGGFTVAERLREKVAALGIAHPSGTLTISLGVAAVVPTADTTAAELMSMADRALYAAKEGGRNRVVLATGAEKKE